MIKGIYLVGLGDDGFEAMRAHPLLAYRDLHALATRRSLKGRHRSFDQQGNKLWPSASTLNKRFIMLISALARETRKAHKEEMTRTRTEIRISLSDQILFKTGSDELDPRSFPTLLSIAKILGEHDKVSVQVEGHTDDSGDVKDNWDLSSDRAVEVVYYLQKHGDLDGRSMEAKGYGQFRPEAPEGMKEIVNWNRRVELVIQSESPVAHEAVYEMERQIGGI